MPIDWNAAKPLGAPAKLIRDAVNRNSPSLATDGGRLVYISEMLGQFSLRSRDMTTGAEKILLQQSTDLRARISPDGSTIAYNLSSAREGEITIYLAPASGGESRKLCDTCGLLYNWTPDGKSLTFRSGSPMKFSVVDIASGQQRVLISNPKYHIHGVEYSPDGRWLAFHYAPVLGSPRAIYLVPLRDSQAAPEGEWIAIMDRPGAHTRPWWSPDGNVIYFLSTAGGKLEIWAQRLQPATKRPISEPFRIYSPFGERYSIRTGTWFGPGIGPRSVIFPVDESTGNIWLAE
jgi:Tol biopolymer transport system component